jgi:hypothetical protein
VRLGRPANVQASLFPTDPTRAGGIVQVIEHLPIKHEALDSSHNTVKQRPAVQR